MILPADHALVTLASQACRGYCPVFEIEVLNNGTVNYKPERFCAVSEPKSFRLNQEEYQDIKAQVAAIPYRKYPSFIQSTIADAPMATLTFHEKDTAYSITGTIDRPGSLIKLENTIRDLALKHGIDTRKAYDPNETSLENAAELLVQLKEEINAGNWITNIQVGNPRLKQRIPPYNSWILIYDKSQMSEKEMISVIEGSVDVVRVQRNMKANERKNE